MTEFQFWVVACGLDPVHHGVVPSCLTQRVLMGTVMSKKAVTTDASLTGWGGIDKGRTVRGN